MQPKKHIRFDWAIKRLLRQKANFGILEGFLSELLKEDIRIQEILDSESNKETPDDNRVAGRFNRVDILVKDEQDELIIIEIQNSYALDYFLRILFGISKAITEHMSEGATYADVKKVISVNIVYFDLGQGDDYIYHGTTDFRGIHDHQPLELTPAQKRLFKKEKIAEVYPEIYLIKVNKFDDKADSTLDEWIYFLKNSEIKQEFSAKGIREANETLKRANMTDEDRREYQRFVEVLSDRASAAMTIEFEVALEVEKRMSRIEAEMREAVEVAAKEAAEVAAKEAEEKAVQETTERVKRAVVVNLLEEGKLSDKQVASIAQVPVSFVVKVRKGQK